MSETGFIHLNGGGHHLMVNPKYIRAYGSYPDGRGGCWVWINEAKQPFFDEHYNGTFENLEAEICRARSVQEGTT